MAAVQNIVTNFLTYNLANVAPQPCHFRYWPQFVGLPFCIKGTRPLQTTGLFSVNIVLEPLRSLGPGRFGARLKGKSYNFVFSFCHTKYIWKKGKYIHTVSDIDIHAWHIE